MDFFNKRYFKESQSRILTLGELTNENTIYIISEILEINKHDEKKKNKEPIQLIITSGGGNIYEGLGLIDVIINSQTPIHTICYGLAMSMSLCVLTAGHHRIMSSRSTLMYHEGGFDLGLMKLTGQNNELKELERIEKICDDLIIERSSLSLNQLKKVKKQQKEWYITPEEALKLNLIDEII